MKKTIILLLILGTFSLARAQTPQSSDRDAIDKACKDYVEGYYLGDTTRIRRAMHPELCKRVLPKRANYKIYATTVNDLVKGSLYKKPDPNPSEPFKITVNVYDVDAGVATAKISTNKLPFIDYAQLAKIDGEWKVVNVLWAYTNDK